MLETCYNIPMTTQLHTAVQAILRMGYFKNQHAQSTTHSHGHEAAVAAVLVQHGFVETDRALYPLMTKTLLGTWADCGIDTDLRRVAGHMPMGSICVQPAGSQGFPDILIRDYNDRFVAIECKSTQAVAPMWNDNVPKPQTIYVLSSGSEDATTVFMGCDVISPAELAVMAAQEAAIAVVVAEYNQQMAAVDQFNRGWVQKSRKQHFQQGGGAKTNYFTHAGRAVCEQNTLRYALD